MRNVKFAALALVVLSACSTTANQKTKLTTEQWRARLFIEKINGKDLYIATQYHRSGSESLEIGAQLNTYAMKQTCPDGYNIKDVRAVGVRLETIPGTTVQNYVHNVETVFSCQ